MQPVALVTGASSGIGETFARQLAARGYRLILVARRADRLQTLAQSLGSAEVLPADLTDPLQLRRVCDRIANEPHFALLVNNAGFGSKRRFWEADLEGQRQMHLLHVNAVVDLSHAALRVMTPRNQGAVINVASVAGFARSPSNVSYCATKSWMIAFTEALALELESAAPGVRVQALCPGFTYSEFHDVLGSDRATIPRRLWMQAGDVVRASLQGLDAGKVIVVPGWKYRFFVLLMNHLPWRIKMAMWRQSPHTRSRL